MNKFFTMLKTELKLSFREMDMVIFALCVPVVVAVILGVIYGNKAAAPGAEYSFLEQSFGALSTIAICAGGVMGLPYWFLGHCFYSLDAGLAVPLEYFWSHIFW